MNFWKTDNLNGPLQFLGRHQQNLKWIIYALLVLNFGYYFFDDWRAAQSTLLPDASLIDANLADWRDELQDENEQAGRVHHPQ